MLHKPLRSPAMDTAMRRVRPPSNWNTSRRPTGTSSVHVWPESSDTSCCVPRQAGKVPNRSSSPYQLSIQRRKNERIPFQREDGLLVHRCATGWAILAGDACHLLQSAAHIHAAPETGAWQTQNCLPDFGAVACDRIYIARIPLPHRHCQIYDKHGSYQSASNANSRMISLPHVSRTSNVSAVQFVRLMLASHSR